MLVTILLKFFCIECDTLGFNAIDTNGTYPNKLLYVFVHMCIKYILISYTIFC